MPFIKAYSDVFRDWEGLIGACIQKAHLVPGLEPMRTDLEAILALGRELKIQQEDLEGSRQATTQRLQQAVDQGRELARMIRSFVKARLGTRSEHLVQFGLVPNRPKSRNKAKPPEPPAPNPPAPADKTTNTTNPPAPSGGTTDPPPPAPGKPAA